MSNATPRHATELRPDSWAEDEREDEREAGARRRWSGPAGARHRWVDCAQERPCRCTARREASARWPGSGLVRRVPVLCTAGGVSSTAKAGHALEHGYDEVFTSDTFADDARHATDRTGVDPALDPVGVDALRRGLDTLSVFGRLVSFGDASGAEPWHLGQPELYAQDRSVAGPSLLALTQSAPETRRSPAERALRTVTDSAVSLSVTAEFLLPDAGEAHRLLGGRTSTGKLPLRIA